MKTRKKIAFKIFQWLITIFVALIILIPIYWIFISSIKPNEDLFTIPIEWIPKHFTLKSYKTLIHQVGIVQQIICTLIITIPTLLVSTIICVLAAFAFERYSSPKLSVAYGLIVFSALIPAIVTARPLYDFFKKLDLIDTYPGLVLLYTSSLIPFSILILRNYLSGIPVDIEEAAEIDGASRWQKITHVTLPSLKSTIIILVLMSLSGIFRSDFGLFYQVTQNSGPLIKVTQTIDTYVYRGLMQTNNIGMSSAAGVYQSVVGFILVMAANGIVRKVDKDSALF